MQHALVCQCSGLVGPKEAHVSGEHGPSSAIACCTCDALFIKANVTVAIMDSLLRGLLLRHATSLQMQVGSRLVWAALIDRSHLHILL